MYGILIAAVFALALVSEVLYHQLRVPREVSWRAAYPMVAFALVGGIAQARGQSGYVWSSMHAVTLFTAFLGPLAIGIRYAARSRHNRA